MLMASRQYSECHELLEDLRKHFPADDEISRLVKAVDEEQKEERKLEALAEARKLLAARRHRGCITLLNKFERGIPRKADIKKPPQGTAEDETEQRKAPTPAATR